MKFTLYVPATETEMLGRIKRGSAIVGQPLYPGGIKKVLVDFEGNTHDAQNLRSYADRVWMAAGRQAEGYPTIARMVVPEETLREVGTFDLEGDDLEIAVREHAALAMWLGLTESAAVPETELRRTTVVLVEEGETTA